MARKIFCIVVFIAICVILLNPSLDYIELCIESQPNQDPIWGLFCLPIVLAGGAGIVTFLLDELLNWIYGPKKGGKK